MLALRLRIYAAIESGPTPRMVRHGTGPASFYTAEDKEGVVSSSNYSAYPGIATPLPTWPYAAVGTYGCSLVIPDATTSFVYSVSAYTRLTGLRMSRHPTHSPSRSFESFVCF